MMSEIKMTCLEPMHATTHPVVALRLGSESYETAHGERFKRNDYIPTRAGVNYLKKKTQDSTQLLHEVLLSPAVLEFTMLVPFDNLGSHEKKFFISEFPVPPDQEKETVLACAKKPGVKLRDMKVPTNINDAVKNSFHFLTVQDRLLLKRAAILGPVFDQHVLEVVSHGIPTEQCTSTPVSFDTGVEVHQQPSDEKHSLLRVHFGHHSGEVTRHGSL
ncbi:uncharacterized protein TNCT_324571 [Trichonephila clavata]|uniref:Uncharacterized protein n=1 Tax=Trichonephila clavata TaxID=2740835 RepID=A0A8X6M3N3_TRICU|nr:uncharacterized protein TNCT_324571 [Trichonephila clavata]